eukprot:2178749-Pleurochrysis_carterae.AAC.2
MLQLTLLSKLVEARAAAYPHRPRAPLPPLPSPPPPPPPPPLLPPSLAADTVVVVASAATAAASCRPRLQSMFNLS